MGMYASFDDVHHGTPAWDLADECTACRNTGVVAYPRTLLEVEYDDCPHGCEPADVVLEMRNSSDAVNHYQWFNLHWDEINAFHLDPEDAALAADSRDQMGGVVDPLLALLTQVMKRSGLAPPPESVAAHHHGLVSSDTDFWGTVHTPEGDLVAHIPSYLVGTPIVLDNWGLTIRYEYMGSTLEVTVDRGMFPYLRFAYSWDYSYRTVDLLS